MRDTTIKKDKVTVVNMDKSFDIYIGRRMHIGYGFLEQSKYHNPFKIGKDGDREEVLEKFIVYWYAPEQSLLRQDALKELPGKRLGCWCKPASCHGDIISRYVEWKLKEKDSLF